MEENLGRTAKVTLNLFNRVLRQLTDLDASRTTEHSLDRMAVVVNEAPAISQLGDQSPSAWQFDPHILPHFRLWHADYLHHGVYALPLVQPSISRWTWPPRYGRK